MIDLFSRVVAFPAGHVKLSEGKDVNCILHPGWYPFQAVLINYLPSESTSFSFFFSCFPYVSQYVPKMFPRCSHIFPNISNGFLVRMGHFSHLPFSSENISAPPRFGTDRRGGVLGTATMVVLMGSYNDLHRNPLVDMGFFLDFMVV